jgi:hypothetical protein
MFLTHDRLMRDLRTWAASNGVDTHDRLMRDLRTWAVSHGVDLVDVIELLDADRHLLLSWVHLHPEANRRVAEAFAERILEGRAASERAASTSAPAS